MTTKTDQNQEYYNNFALSTKSFGDLILNCDINKVNAILHNSGNFNSNENFLMILGHLKDYYQKSDVKGIEISDTYVIFVENENLNRNIDSFYQKNHKYIGLANTNISLLTIGKSLEDIVKKYCDEHDDPFH